MGFRVKFDDGCSPLNIKNNRNARYWDIKYQFKNLVDETFPQATPQNDANDTLEAIEFSSINSYGSEVLKKSKSISQTKVPRSEVEHMQKQIESLHAFAENPNIPEDRRLFFRNFRLPDPNQMPYAWRISGILRKRLHILWGIGATPNGDGTFLPKTSISEKSPTDVSKNWSDNHLRYRIEDMLHSSSGGSRISKGSLTSFAYILFIILLACLFFVGAKYGIPWVQQNFSSPVTIISPDDKDQNTSGDNNSKKDDNNGQNISGGDDSKKDDNNGQNISGDNNSKKDDNNGQNISGGDDSKKDDNNGQNISGGDDSKKDDNNGQNISGGDDSKKDDNNGQNTSGGDDSKKDDNNGQNTSSGDDSKKDDNNGQNTSSGDDSKKDDNNGQNISSGDDSKKDDNNGQNISSGDDSKKDDGNGQDTSGGDNVKKPYFPKKPEKKDVDYTFSIKADIVENNGDIANVKFYVSPDSSIGEKSYKISNWKVNQQNLARTGDTFTHKLSYRKRYIITADVSINGKPQKVSPYQWNSIDVPVWMITKVGDNDKEYQLICTNASNVKYSVKRWEKPVFYDGNYDKLEKFTLTKHNINGNNKIEIDWSQEHVGEYFMELVATVEYSVPWQKNSTTQVIRELFILNNGSSDKAILTKKFDFAKSRTYCCIARLEDGNLITGTAFAINEKFLVTNHHVAVGGPMPELYGTKDNSLFVDKKQPLFLVNQENKFFAKVIYTCRDTDITLLRICDSNLQETDRVLPYFFSISATDSVKIGREVMSLGYPAGSGNPESNPPRFVYSKIENIIDGIHVGHYSGTRPGYSGGPLVDLENLSFVLGVNRAGIKEQTGYKGINLATHIKVVQQNFLPIIKKWSSQK